MSENNTQTPATAKPSQLPTNPKRKLKVCPEKQKELIEEVYRRARAAGTYAVQYNHPEAVRKEREGRNPHWAHLRSPEPEDPETPAQPLSSVSPVSPVSPASQLQSWQDFMEEALEDSRNGELPFITKEDSDSLPEVQPTSGFAK